MNNKTQLTNCAKQIHALALDAYRELGSGFKEDTFQKALAICFRQTNIKYLKETNLEIFFRKESLGVFRLDFLLPAQSTKAWKLTKPIIIETKTGTGIKNDARLQLKNYLSSLPHNSSDSLSQVREGIIINWRGNEDALATETTNAVELELWTMKKSQLKQIVALNDPV